MGVVSSTAACFEKPDARPALRKGVCQAQPGHAAPHDYEIGGGRQALPDPNESPRCGL